MNKSIILSSCLILTSVVCISIHAQTLTPSSTTNSPASGMMNGGKKHHHNQSCLNIATACESAGYHLSRNMPDENVWNMPGENVWKDCVKPILSGSTVSGVTASPSDIQACKAHKAEWKNKHMNKTQEMTPQTPTSSSEALDIENH